MCRRIDTMCFDSVVDNLSPSWTAPGRYERRAHGRVRRDTVVNILTTTVRERVSL